MDPVLSKLLADPRKREALAWLREKDGEFRNAGLRLAIVECLYGKGAKEVCAVPSEYWGLEGQSIGHLIVELSAKPDQRRAVLEWLSQHAQLMGFDAVTDSGQQFEYLKLD